MAKECRKFGLSLILASQEIKDFDQSLFAAVSNSLTLRLLEADAQKMAKNCGIPYDKVKLYADRIKQMPKFQALFNREGLREPVKVALGGVTLLANIAWQSRTAAMTAELDCRFLAEGRNR